MIFDQYQRYKTVEIITNIVKEKIHKQKLTILEIGANEECNLEKMLPEDEIQYSDIILTEKMKNRERFIQLNGSNMPEIGDDQYDIVVALDVLEHVPAIRRRAFISEVGRVAKYMAIVCFPYKATNIDSAEKRTNSYYKMIYGNDHKWLAEHIQNGLPQIREVEQMLLEENISFKEFYHGDVFLWEEMMKGLFTAYDLKNGGDYFEQIDKLYEEQIYFNDKSSTSYRVFIMISRNEKLLQDVNEKMQGQYTDKIPDKVSGLVYRCIDDIKYRLINEQRRKVSIQHQVYYTYDGKFSENDKITFTSENENANLIHVDQKIEIDERYKAVRFDPLEGECCILKNLMIDSNVGKIDFRVVNGICKDEQIVFCEEDPQIYIELIDKGIKWIHVQTDILRTEFPEMVIRYPMYQKIDNSFDKLMERMEENSDSITLFRNMFSEQMQKQNELNAKCEEIQASLAEMLENVQRIRLEKEKWEEESKYWEERCSRMEQTISWKITGILRVLGKAFGK